MSTDLYFNGIKPPDNKWKQMKKIYDSCQDAGVTVPEEVQEFFEDEPPDESGVVVSLPSDTYTEWRTECYWGYEIDLTKLDKNIKLLRVYLG